MSKSDLSKQNKRAEVIIKVCAEKMTATEAAKDLGVSRKTYYQWQKKALAAMMESLQDGQGGRPSQQEDAQTQSLREEQERLKQENALLSIRLNIQKLMAEDMSQLPLIRKSKGYRTQKKTADP